MSYEGKKRRYFTGTEIVLWISSVILILVSFLIFGGSSYISLIASLIGVTALIFIAKGNPIGTVINRDFQPALRYYIVFLFVLRRDADIFGNDNAYGSIFADFLAEESLQRKQVRSKSAETKTKRIYCYGSSCDYCNNGILLCIEIFQHGELNTEYTVYNNKFYGCVLNIQTQSILCLLVCRKRCNFDCFVVIGSCRKYIVYVRCGMFRCFFCQRYIWIC